MNSTETATAAENAGGGKEESREAGTSHSGEEVYHPVRCEQCNTEVGVFDKDEVYHFFNVISSYN